MLLLPLIHQLSVHRVRSFVRPAPAPPVDEHREGVTSTDANAQDVESEEDIDIGSIQIAGIENVATSASVIAGGSHEFFDIRFKIFPDSFIPAPATVSEVADGNPNDNVSILTDTINNSVDDIRLDKVSSSTRLHNTPDRGGLKIKSGDANASQENNSATSLTDSTALPSEVVAAEPATLAAGLAKSVLVTSAASWIQSVAQPWWATGGAPTAAKPTPADAVVTEVNTIDHAATCDMKQPEDSDIQTLSSLEANTLGATVDVASTPLAADINTNPTVDCPPVSLPVGAGDNTEHSGASSSKGSAVERQSRQQEAGPPVNKMAAKLAKLRAAKIAK